MPCKVGLTFKKLYIINNQIYKTMSSKFDYLISKIETANFLDSPFKHIEINDFLREDDFKDIISSPEINTPECKSDEEVFTSLFDRGYKLIPFPGAITDHNEYIKNRKDGKKSDSHSATESAGVVLRLMEPKTDILSELKEFIESDEFNEALAKKFNLPYNQCTKDSGIQKYLDEYEISPHPDLRKKALTFMVNINNSYNSEDKNHHTHYLRFKPEKKYVMEFWKGNPLIERCWVPWDWCETIKEQKQNNSIVNFSPSFDTIHAVKASYSHLDGQRTQIYGNLWFKEDEKGDFISSSKRLDWWDFDFKEAPAVTASSLTSKSFKLLRKLFSNNRTKLDSSRSDHY